MSAAQATKQGVQAIRKAAADFLRAKIAEGETILGQIGAKLIEVQGTYSAADADDFFVWAQNVTGWKKQQIVNTMAAVTVRESLTKQQNTKTAAWSRDTMAQVSRFSPAERKAVLQATKATRPSAADLRATRDRLHEEGKLGDGETSPRNRKSASEHTRELADTLTPRIAAVLKGNRNALDLIAFGATLAQDAAFGERDVPAAKDVAAAVRRIKLDAQAKQRKAAKQQTAAK